ncbi:MAG: hypothetical protein ACRDL0_02805 [Thermoleophilaceae bacterium]
MPVVVRGGAIGITDGRAPSTHILKAPIARFDDTGQHRPILGRVVELVRSRGSHLAEELR